VIRNPPEDGKYDALKAALTGSLELTKDQKVRKILHAPELGARDPMDLWSDLKSWAEGITVEDVLMQVFLERLPADIQPILQADQRTPHDVVLRARSLIQGHPQVSAVSSTSKSSLCFYHKNFGVKARRCKSPCSWKKGKRVNNIECDDLHDDLPENDYAGCR